MVEINSLPPYEFYIFWAGETGTCEEISSQFLDTMKKQSMKDLGAEVKAPVRLEFDQFAQSGIANKNTLKLCVFMTSSTGDGESPENGLQFRVWLSKM
jgi:sulfite reductase alpha subunit-like flavoprotein